MPSWSDLYQLSRWQTLKYQDRADFYQPGRVVVDPTTRRGSPRRYTLDVPTYANVPGYFIATEDFEEATLLGQSTENNIMTQNRYYCHVGQPVDTNWIIIIRQSFRAHSLIGIPQIVQGEPKPMASLPRMPNNQLKIYLKPGVQ